MKKLFSVLIVVALLLSMAACGGGTATSPTPATTESTAVSQGTETSPSPATTWPTGYKIGMNLFIQGSYVFDTMVRQNNVLLEDPSVGATLQLFNDEQNIEKITTDVENMINSGVDGGMWWAIIPPHYTVGPQKFQDANLPWVLFDAYPGWPDGNGMVGKETIRDMSTFAGMIGCSNYESGVAMAEAALADGVKKCIVMANVIGSGVDDRAVGFQTTFEAGGGTVLEVSHEGTAGSAHIAAMQNLFAAHPEADSLFAVGSDYITGAIPIVETLGKDIKLYGIDITPELLTAMEQGKVAALAGSHWVDSSLCAALLVNAIDGHKILDADGKPLWIDTFPMKVLPAKYASLYSKAFMDNMPWSAEDLKPLLYRNNPDVTAQTFTDMIDNYSVENVFKAKYEEGIFTKEELAAVGINVQ